MTTPETLAGREIWHFAALKFLLILFFSNEDGDYIVSYSGVSI